VVAVSQGHRILADVDAIELKAQRRIHVQRLAPIGFQLRAAAHDTRFVADHKRDAR